MSPVPKPSLELPPAGQALDPPLDPLVREALAWIVRLHSGDETEADCAAFEDWKAASDDHIAAARQAEVLWQSLRPALRTYRGSRRRLLSLVLAGTGIALAALAVLRPQPYAQLVADYRTTTGEVRSIALKDGSVVDLDTGTSFDVSDDQRTLTLYTGQVFVKVAPDPSRPFRVVTDQAETRALGTAFAVRLDGDSERIVVTEHAVRVTEDATRRSVEVLEGQVVEIGPARSGKPHSADVDALLAWRKGGLHFRDQPFGTVVAEVERYRHGRIVVLDEDVRRLLVTGNFDVSDTDSFLNAAAVSLPVSVARLPGLVVVWRDKSRPLPTR